MALSFFEGNVGVGYSAEECKCDQLEVGSTCDLCLLFPGLDVGSAAHGIVMDLHGRSWYAVHL